MAMSLLLEGTRTGGGWTNGGRFLDYTTKEGRESIVDRNPRVTQASEIW